MQLFFKGFFDFVANLQRVVMQITIWKNLFCKLQEELLQLMLFFKRFVLRQYRNIFRSKNKKRLESIFLHEISFFGVTFSIDRYYTISAWGDIVLDIVESLIIRSPQLSGVENTISRGIRITSNYLSPRGTVRSIDATSLPSVIHPSPLAFSSYLCSVHHFSSLWQRQFVRLPIRHRGHKRAENSPRQFRDLQREPEQGKEIGKRWRGWGYLQWSVAKFQLRVYQRLIRLSRPA